MITAPISLRATFALGLCTVLLVATAACQSTGDEGAPVAEDDLASIKDNVIDITWTCFANRPDSSGKNSQEEYCEWTRRARSVDGKLLCEFNSNFDSTRPLYLTQNENDPAYNETFANSQQYLIGGTEPTGQVRKGIIPSCVENKGTCKAPNCVCGRKSDPQICAVLGTLARNRCAVEMVASPQVTAQVPTGIQERNPVVAVQLEIPRSLKEVCFYKNQRTADEKDVVVPGVKPEVEKTYVRCFLAKDQMTNVQTCDGLAKSLTVSAKARVTDPASCDMAAVKAELDGRTPNACE